MTATTNQDHETQTKGGKAPAKTSRAPSGVMFNDALTLLKILQIIPQHDAVDTDEIDERLRREGIDLPRRTLQRYLQTLRSQTAFPIDCDETVRPRRYRWNPNAKGIQLPKLSPVEAVLLRMAEASLRQHLPTGPLGGLKPLLRAARQELVRHAETSLADLADGTLTPSWFEKIHVTPKTLPVGVPPIRAGVFEAAVLALFSERVLHGRYRRDSGRFSEIDLHPLGVIAHQSRTFVVGYEEPQGLKNRLAKLRARRQAEAGKPVEVKTPEIGLYALHRFEEARVSYLPAIVPEDFSLEDFVRRANFEGKRSRTIRLTVVTDRAELVREVLESPLSATQEAAVDPDSTDDAPLWRIVALLEDSALLDAWLAQRAEWIVRSTKEQLRAPEPLTTPGSWPL